jgi:hypothetical protein
VHVSLLDSVVCSALRAGTVGTVPAYCCCRSCAAPSQTNSHGVYTSWQSGAGQSVWYLQTSLINSSGDGLQVAAIQPSLLTSPHSGMQSDAKLGSWYGKLGRYLASSSSSGLSTKIGAGLLRDCIGVDCPTTSVVCSVTRRWRQFSTCSSPAPSPSRSGMTYYPGWGCPVDHLTKTPRSLNGGSLSGNTPQRQCAKD